MCWLYLSIVRSRMFRAAEGERLLSFVNRTAARDEAVDAAMASDTGERPRSSDFENVTVC